MTHEGRQFYNHFVKSERGEGKNDVWFQKSSLYYNFLSGNTLIERAQKKSQVYDYSSNLPPSTSPPSLPSSHDFNHSYTVNVTAWPGATRMMRGVMPL